MIDATRTQHSWIKAGRNPLKINALSLVFAMVLLSAIAWAEPVELSGKVVDEAGEPVSGASIMAYTMSRGWAGFEHMADAKSSDDGHFDISFERPPTRWSMYSLIVQHPEYGFTTLMQHEIDFGGKDAAKLELVLPKGGAVKGKVIDTAGKAVEGALVVPMVSTPRPDTAGGPMVLYPNEQLVSAVTDRTGAFTLDGLPEKATLVLGVRAAGYAGTVFGMGAVGRGLPQGDIKVGATDVNVELGPEAVVSGEVTFEEGGGAAGAVVRAMPDVGEQYDPAMVLTAMMLGPLEAKTDEAGKFTIAGLPAGKWALSVEYPDWTAAALHGIEVQEGATVGDQNIVLTKGVLISGKFVMAETGEPVPDGVVMIQSSPAQASPFTGSEPIYAKEDGTFSLRQPPGKVTLYGQAGESGGVSRENARQELDLEAGPDRTGLVFTVTPAVTFKGKVVDADGKPVEGAQIKSRRGMRDIVVSGSDGSFELSLAGRTPGEYEWIILEATHPDKPGQRGLLGKEFKSASDATGDIVLADTVKVTGRVVDVDGKPLAGATVTSHMHFGRMSTSDKTVTTGEDGKYEFTELVAGTTYWILATADGYGQDKCDQFIAREPREFPDLVLLVADQVIEGTVTDLDGDAAAGVQVYANSNSTGYRQAVTDEKGHFRLEGLVDDSIQINAYKNDDGNYVSGNAKAEAGDLDVEIVMGGQSRSPEDQAKQVLVGKEAPAIDAAHWIVGKAVSLADMKGKIVVLAFWDSSKEGDTLAPALKLLAEKHSDVAVVCVHVPTEDASRVKKNVEAAGLTCPVAVDKPDIDKKGKGATAVAYQVKKPPAVFIIDAEGNLAYQQVSLVALDQALGILKESK